MQHVVIYYCKTCHFLKPAQELARALEAECGATTELRSAFWGTFRVEVDGEEIYNRWKTRGWIGRLGLGCNPRVPEIIASVRARQSSALTAE